MKAVYFGRAHIYIYLFLLNESIQSLNVKLNIKIQAFPDQKNRQYMEISKSRAQQNKFIIYNLILQNIFITMAATVWVGHRRNTCPLPLPK